MYHFGLNEADLAILANLSLGETAGSQGHDNFHELIEVIHLNCRARLMSSIHHGPRTLHNDLILS